MAKIDFGDKLKDTLKKTSDSVVNAAQKVDVKGMKESVKEAAQKAGTVAKVSTEQAVDKVKAVISKKEAERKQLEEQKSIEPQVITEVLAINAVKVFYYFMAVDGEVTASEEEKFDLIGKEIDPDFTEHKEKIVTGCKDQLAKLIDKEEYYDVIQDGIEEALMAEQFLENGTISPKHLVWNLLTIAYSDTEYSDDERKLMKYIVRKLNIAKDVFLEMENSYLTIEDINREINWLKTTDRPYLEIEAQVKELEKREQDVFESVKALIYL